MVTIAVAQLNTVEKAYQDHLAYESVGNGVVSTATADVWGAPAAAGQAYVLMQAESGHPTLIRFIEAQPPASYAPMLTDGWNATELLSTDPDAIAERLADSPFRIVGPPADLWEAPNAPRAMQAIGPGNELLYLTRNNDFVMKTLVDRVFIMVLGGPSMDAFAQRLPADTQYPLAIASLNGPFLLELDEYPRGATMPRERRAGELPPGVAMVSFSVADVDALDLDFRGAPASLPEAPYAGATVAVAVGPAGEWLEFVEPAEAD
jgi:hypothetical protein